MPKQICMSTTSSRLGLAAKKKQISVYRLNRLKQGYNLWTPLSFISVSALFLSEQCNSKKKKKKKNVQIEK